MRPSLPPISTIDQDPDEYLAFIEELEHAAELLLAPTMANERMAMVVVDSLADRLLYQHAHSCFRASEAPIASMTKPFSPAKRREILESFTKKVRLALIDERFFVFLDPLLDELDAEIFRVAHRYRNAGYHRGEHKRALTGPLSRLYAQAVGRAFTRSTNHSFAGHSPEAGDTLRRRWPKGAEELDGSTPRSVTGPITEAITKPLTVETKELAGQLLDDSERRFAEIDQTLEWLRRDLDDEQIGELIEAAQHWSEHRGDEELHRLGHEEQVLTDAVREEDEPNEELARAVIQNKVAQFKRMEHLKEGTDIRVALTSVEPLRRRACRLRAKTEIAPLLHAYRELDELVGLLEAAIEWVARSWDRSVQQAIDEARGK